MKWDIRDIAPQKGRIVIVTGANSGLGFIAARELALKGAKVIMACRRIQKAEEARQRILAGHPEMEPEVWPLDLASLASVKSFSERYAATHHRLDLLINNAGLMAIPYRRTADGFEMQFGVNHLAHFALTARLWPLIGAADQPRIVTVSSSAHKFGRIRYRDINWERRYSKWGAYGMSKLANLLFTKELAGRLSALRDPAIAAAAHPGYADTELQTKGALMRGSALNAGLFRLANRIAAQSAEMGTLPVLYAATALGVSQGGYYGPGGIMHMRGWPGPDRPNPKLVNDEAAARLWGLSETLTGLEFNL